MEESSLIASDEEESNLGTGEISEAEEWLFSDVEETPDSDNTVPLSIDYNARVVGDEEKCGNEGDDCDMFFFDRKDNFGQIDSESGLHTSTEDLDISDEEQFCNASTKPPINLERIASTSSKKDGNSLSTLDYSHTKFKGGSSLDFPHMRADDKQRKSLSGLTIAGLPFPIKTASSFVEPATQKVINNSSSENVFPSSYIEKNDMDDLYDEPETPPMTCLEFLKSEYSDHDTDAEDISAGSTDETVEPNKTNMLNSKSCNLFDIPASLSGLSFRNVDERKDSYPDDSRRSSTAEFLTEDETFNLENFCDRGRKRIKKRDFIVSENGEKSDSGTDEEMIGDK